MLLLMLLVAAVALGIIGALGTDTLSETLRAGSRRASTVAGL
ncbi:hypothetical protein ACIQ6Y_01335 [Streptomyces sp. NPDC096205]